MNESDKVKKRPVRAFAAFEDKSSQKKGVAIRSPQWKWAGKNINNRLAFSWRHFRLNGAVPKTLQIHTY